MEPITKEQEEYLITMLMLGYTSGDIDETEIYVVNQLSAIEIYSKKSGMISLIIGNKRLDTSTVLTRAARERGVVISIIDYIKKTGTIVRAIVNFRTTNTEDRILYEKTDSLNDDVSIRELYGMRFHRIEPNNWIKPEIFLRHTSIAVSDLREPDQEQ